MSLTIGALTGISVKEQLLQQRAQAASTPSLTDQAVANYGDRVSLQASLDDPFLTYSAEPKDQDDSWKNDILLRRLLSEIKYAHIPVARRKALIAKVVASWPNLEAKDQADFVQLVRLQVEAEENIHQTELEAKDLNELDDYIADKLDIERTPALEMIDSARIV